MLERRSFHRAVSMSDEEGRRAAHAKRTVSHVPPAFFHPCFPPIFYSFSAHLYRSVFFLKLFSVRHFTLLFQPDFYETYDVMRSICYNNKRQMPCFKSLRLRMMFCRISDMRICGMSNLVNFGIEINTERVEKTADLAVRF